VHTAIANAEHFIYIENQFFVTSSADPDDPPPSSNSPALSNSSNNSGSSGNPGGHGNSGGWTVWDGGGTGYASLSNSPALSNGSNSSGSGGNQGGNGGSAASNGNQGNGPVVNRIGYALYRRIRRAHVAGTPFRVIVMLPLAPAFPGMHLLSLSLSHPPTSTCVLTHTHSRMVVSLCVSVCLSGSVCVSLSLSLSLCVSFSLSLCARILR
jgi:hypothetical protein